MFSCCSKKFKRKDVSSLPNQCLAKSGSKRMSLCASCKGSLTVEAACVTPMFLSCMIAFLNLFGAIDVAGSVAGQMQRTGKEMAVNACIQDALPQKAKTAAGVLEVSYAANAVRQAASGRAKQLRMTRSSIRKDNEMIDLVAEYRLHWNVPFLHLADLPVLQRVRVRAWTGKCTKKENEEEAASADQTVYITENGSVYHKSRSCTHIRLSVRQVGKEQALQMRNEAGGKYHPCEICKGDGKGQVYLTDTGTRYHSSPSCSGLKRGVIAVPLTQVEGWKPCLRCGG